MKRGLKNAILWGGSLSLGAVSGFFGGGGGMLAVPLLQCSGLDVKRAHASALMVMLPVCMVSACVYIINGYFDFKSLACAVIGVCLGGALGAVLLDKIKGSALSLIFALIMIAAGVKCIIP